jgi:hypothetical protein
MKREEQNTGAMAGDETMTIDTTTKQQIIGGLRFERRRFESARRSESKTVLVHEKETMAHLTTYEKILEPLQGLWCFGKGRWRTLSSCKGLVGGLLRRSRYESRYEKEKRSLSEGMSRRDHHQEEKDM